jgi:hypothetical protein
MTPWTGDDVFVDRWLAPDDLRTAFAQALHVGPATIQVLDDHISEQTPMLPNRTLLCEVLPVQGDMAQRVNVYVHDATLTSVDPAAVYSYVCTLLRCRCLIPDATPEQARNPAAYLLIALTGHRQPVSIDLVEREYDDAVVIVRSHAP